MKYFIFISFCFFLVSCEFTIKTPDKATIQQGPKIRNGIQIKKNSVKLEQAFLLSEDGVLLPEDNKIEVKQRIKLRLIADGWQEKDGKVYIDASQKVITDKGEILLDANNLFQKDSIESIDAKDAKYINLEFWLNEVTELFDYIRIEFRVWDKLGGGEISGSYKLFLK